MPPWWRKSSAKEAKKKTASESLIDTLHRKFRSPESKSPSNRSNSRGSRRRSSDIVSEIGSQSRAESRVSSPTKHVARCQSFAERANALPLPLPGLRSIEVISTDTGAGTGKTKSERISKQSSFLLPRPAGIRQRPDPNDVEGELVVALISSECSSESDDPSDSRPRSPLSNDYDMYRKTPISSPKRSVKDRTPAIATISPVPANVSCNKNISSSPPRRRPLGSRVPNLQVPPPHHGAFYSAPDSSMSSPSRSPMRYGQCSSPGSGQTSGHNSMGGDMAGPFWQQPSRGSPEYSPIPSPRMTSPGPSSRIHSGAVTPTHPRAGGGVYSESQSNWPDDGKQQSHRLPLPPINIASPSPFSHPNSALASPSVPRSPARAESLASPGSRWKKGKLLGRGTFGHVYVGFNSKTGEMCAMKEVTLFADDAKSKESAKQLGQEISLLSRLTHPNIVQYHGSETVDDRLYIYLEYVSGGSIHKILQEYGKLGESAIRSYTQQILAGLSYLHAKKTVHRDIKGANILVDPNGRVKLADFGMAKHIAGQSCPLSFKGSPYWMAPEVITNSSGCSLAVDIWSLGCTVLEMATSSPPWSQYEGVAAMFKIGNSKELPTIPDYLSDEGKEFIKLCLQRNPLHRPSAVQLLEHPFVKSAAPVSCSASPNHPSVMYSVKSVGLGQARNLQLSDEDGLAIHSSRVSKSSFYSSDIYIPRNISCPVSPIGSPLLYPRSPPQHMKGMMSPSPISSPHVRSGSSTPLTGGFGTIPFHNQSVASQEGFSNIRKRPPSPCANSPSYWDPDILQGAQASVKFSSSNNDSFGNQLKKATNGEPYDGKYRTPLDLAPSKYPYMTGGCPFFEGDAQTNY